MSHEVRHLSQADLQLISRATREIHVAELQDLINISIQYGPPIIAQGRMHHIIQHDLPPIFWKALGVFVEWGAGNIYKDQHGSSYLLQAGSDHIERMLKLIAERLDNASGQGENQSGLSRPFQRPRIKSKKSYNDSMELG